MTKTHAFQLKLLSLVIISLPFSVITLKAEELALQPPGPERQAELRNLLNQDCGSCHGLTLKGGLGRPLTAQHLADMDHEMVKHVILFGVDQTPMPGWLGLLSEQEADWIANALKTGAFQQ